MQLATGQRSICYRHGCTAAFACDGRANVSSCQVSTHINHRPLLAKRLPCRVGSHSTRIRLDTHPSGAAAQAAPPLQSSVATTLPQRTEGRPSEATVRSNHPAALIDEHDMCDLDSPLSAGQARRSHGLTLPSTANAVPTAHVVRKPLGKRPAHAVAIKRRSPRFLNHPTWKSMPLHVPRASAIIANIVGEDRRLVSG